MNHIKFTIKQFLANIGLYHPSLGIKSSHETKVANLLKYKTSEIEILVETGTEFGTMIKSIGHRFQRVYSIELDVDLFRKATAMFENEKHITLVQGNSANKINTVLNMIAGPALFWLDAHGTGSLDIRKSNHCPAYVELTSIFSHPVKGHVILVDDARHFDRYSIRMIKKLAKAEGYRCVIKDGLIIINR